MSNLIDREGTFRGKPLDWGVSESKNGFPQMVIELSALEHFNEETGEYESWSEYEQTIRAFLVMYSNSTGEWKEAGSNVTQIKKVFAWDGKDFQTLAEGKYEDTMLMFQVKSSTFEGKTKLQVSWIDTADANPVRTLQKFDTEKLKGMAAKMGGMIPGSTTTPAPAKAPATPPKGKPRSPKATPKTAATPVATPATPAPTPSAAPETPPPSPAPTAPAVPSAPPVETKESAWKAVCETRSADMSDAKLAEIWVDEATKIGKAEEQYTSADWATLKLAVQKRTAKF
jgi:hypothetical protein